MAMKIRIVDRGLDRMQRALDGYARRAEAAVSSSVGKLAHELRRDIVTGIKKQAPGGIKFKPLADSTIQRKGSSKALIDHGDLIRSVNVTNLGGLSYFVGVHRQVTGKNGKPMVNIAEIHEFGSKKVKNRPPARPFLRPSYKQWKHSAEKRFADMVGAALRLPVAAGIRKTFSRKAGVITFGGGS